MKKGFKICAHCGEEKSGLDFACRLPGHDVSGGLMPKCRECMNALDRARRKRRRVLMGLDPDPVWEAQQLELVAQDKAAEAARRAAKLSNLPPV